VEIIELLQPVTLNKDDLEPIIIETGTLLKVLMVNHPHILLVMNQVFLFWLIFQKKKSTFHILNAFLYTL